MGSQESKVEQPLRQEIITQETSLSSSPTSSPILTPLDPRSPSANIARTPLDVVLGPKTSPPPDDLETDDVDDNQVENVVLGIDPRSPTVEFSRTPIIVATVAKDKKKLQNKNLDNVRKSEIQTTPLTTSKKTPKVVPPKLLETSPVSIISNYSKRKSFVGLLETNLDFTETDLDTVCQSQSVLNKSIPEETTQSLDELETETDSKEISESCDVPEVQEVDEETEISTEPALADEKVINVTAQVKDFDKKLTNLIYEDGDDVQLTPRSMKVRENNRTPLSIRNSNEDSKRKSRLRVSDKPRKSEISKIPVFKDLGRKMKVQCENTPPRRQEGGLKTKISRWDADKTLVI